MSNYSLYILLIYLASFLTIFINLYISKKLGGLLGYLLSFCCFLLAALRPDYFPDLDTYELIYEQASSGNFTDISYWVMHGEPGFKIIAYTLNIFNFNFSLFLVFYAFLSFILLVVTSRISKIDFIYLWFSYFSMYFITRDLGVIRVSIASHLIVIALCQKRTVNKILTLLFSSISFQYFSIIAIIPIIFAKYKFKYKYLILSLPVAFIIRDYIVFDNILNFVPAIQSDTYSSTEMVTNSSNNDLLPIMRNGILAFIIMLILRAEVNEERARIWILSSFLSLLIYIIAGNIPIVAQRFSAYFAAILPVVFAYKLKISEGKDVVFYSLLMLLIGNFISLFYYNDFVWRGY